MTQGPCSEEREPAVAPGIAPGGLRAPTTAPEGAGARSRARYRRAGASLGMGMLERCVSVAVSFARVPLLLHGLGMFGYGLWVTTLGLVQMVGWLSLGMQYGIVNLIAEARGREDRARVRGVVATAVAVYGGLAILALLLVGAIIAVAPVHWLLGAHPEHEVTIKLLCGICLAGFASSLPLSVFTAALNGHQEQYVVSTWRVVGSLLQLVVLCIMVLGLRSGLIALTLAATSTELGLNALMGAWILWRWRPEIRFHASDLSRTVARQLFSLGPPFLLADLANSFKYQTGTIVISHFLGPSSVAVFSVPFIMATSGLGLIGLLSSVFWPAYAEAAAKGDWEWLTRAFRRSASTGFCVAGLAATVMVASGQDLVTLWTGGEVTCSTLLLAWLGLWLLGQVWEGACATLLCALFKNWPVALVVLAEAAFGALVGMVAVIHSGQAGVAMAIGAAAALAGGLVLPALLSTIERDRVRLGERLVLRSASLAALATCAALVCRVEWGPGLVGRLLATTTVAVAAYAILGWLVLFPSSLREEARGRLRVWLGGGVRSEVSG